MDEKQDKAFHNGRQFLDRPILGRDRGRSNLRDRNSFPTELQRHARGVSKSDSSINRDRKVLVLLIGNKEDGVNWEEEISQFAESVVDAARHDWKNGGLGKSVNIRLPKDAHQLIRRASRRSGPPPQEVRSSFQADLQRAMCRRLPKGNPQVEIRQHRRVWRLIATGL